MQGRGYVRALRASSSYFLRKKFLKNLRGKVQFSGYSKISTGEIRTREIRLGGGQLVLARYLSARSNPISRLSIWQLHISRNRQSPIFAVRMGTCFASLKSWGKALTGRRTFLELLLQYLLYTLKDPPVANTKCFFSAF